RNRSFIIDAVSECPRASGHVESRNRSAGVAHESAELALGKPCDRPLAVNAVRLRSECCCTFDHGELDIGLAERSRRQSQRANPRTYESFCEHISSLTLPIVFVLRAIRPRDTCPTVLALSRFKFAPRAG